MTTLTSHAVHEAGFDWIGAIPPHWNRIRNAGLFRERNERGREDLELLAVTIAHGVLPQREYMEMSGRRLSASESGDLSNYKLVRRGDLVYNRMRMWQGAIGLAPCDGIVSPAYVVLKPLPGVNPRYFEYLFKTQAFICEAGRYSYGIADDQNSLRFEDFKTLYSAVPPFEEQRRIAAFLDHETARIDELVREQEILLSLLSQRWSGLVMAALTGQVKPNEKGAGEWQQVESKFWPERIPSNWVLAPLKRKLLRNDSGAWGAEPDSDEGYLTIVMRSTEQTIDGTWRLNHPAYRRLSSAERKATMLLEGDLLVTKSSGSQDHIGKTTLVDKEVANLEAGFSNFMQRLRFDRSVLPEFGWYLLNSDIARQQFAYLSTTTSGLANLNAEIIGGVVALFPPLEEQRSIVAFLNTALARNTELSLQTSRAIGHLLERRSALIGAAVTGQLDLSDWQRPEPGAVAEVA